MKKLRRSLNRRLKAGPMIWSAAVAIAGLFFALPDLNLPSDPQAALQELTRRLSGTEAPAQRTSRAASSGDLQGTASVVDGDTIDIHGQRIRLHAIDAPESAQRCWRGSQEWRCGQAASLALQDKIGRRPVRCEQVSRDRYNRIVARCFEGATNLNAWLVEEGYAVAAAQYGKDYVAHEARAKAARRGIWAGQFVEPSAWRKGVRQPEG